MAVLSNAHTHTIFCDGKNTAEEMVLSAIENGFVSLGFSGHSFVYPDDGYTMKPEAEKAYIAEIRRLKEKYKDRIAIHLGLELDYYSHIDLSPYEYWIGSVHHYEDPETGKRYAYDWKAEHFGEMLKEAFGGDPIRLAKTYYRDVTAHIISSQAHIIGHFNLITKFNKQGHFIDEDDPAYKRVAGEALLDCAATGAICELNTGAISRGYTDEPYPNVWMLKLLAEHHYPIIITSDCHQKDRLTAAFPEAEELAKACGFKSVMRLGRDSLFEEVPLI